MQATGRQQGNLRGYPKNDTVLDISQHAHLRASRPTKLHLQSTPGTRSMIRRSGCGPERQGTPVAKGFYVMCLAYYGLGIA